MSRRFRLRLQKWISIRANRFAFKWRTSVHRSSESIGYTSEMFAYI